MLTCACGARFEVDESLAGQEVLCPECHQAVKALQAGQQPRITSGWALASALLALVGAFTVVGTLIAVVLGFVALVSIRRHRDRLTGAGFAVFGICLGILFTVLTVVALNAGELFGLESWLLQRNLERDLDTSGPLEIVEAEDGFAITRPNEKWGKVPDEDSGDSAVSDFQGGLDLLLMQMARHTYIDVQSIPPVGPFRTLEQHKDEILSDLEDQHRPRNLFDDDDNGPHPAVRIRRHGERRLDTKDGVEGREMELEVRCAGRPWLFLIRLYRRGNDGTVYVVRAYGPKRRFTEIRGELEAALDSFRILRP